MDAKLEHWEIGEDEDGRLVFRHRGSNQTLAFNANGRIESSGDPIIYSNDRVYLVHNNTGSYLNSTSFHGSTNRPDAFIGWTFWRRPADSDSNLTIVAGSAPTE